MQINNTAIKISDVSFEETELQFPSLIVSKSYSFHSLKEASALATVIAQACPNPKRVELGLNEIFLNAIEHGVLSLHYNQDHDVFEPEVRFNKIEKLLEKDENKHKNVRVLLHKNPTYISITVYDSGTGFNYKEHLAKRIGQSTLFNGRGIFLAKHFSFDNLEYLGCGNIAKCYVYL